MSEMTKSRQIGFGAMKTGMDRKTARRYVKGGKLPSELVVPRDWRTRPDPFVEDWPTIEVRLREEPGFEAKTLFEELQEKAPGPLRRRAAADPAAPGAVVAGGAGPGQGRGAGTAAPRRRGHADGLHLDRRVGRDDRRRAVGSPAVRVGAALLELAVGDGLRVGVDEGAAAGDPARPPSGRKPGAQPGHKGHHRELLPPDKRPDRVAKGSEVVGLLRL